MRTIRIIYRAMAWCLLTGLSSCVPYHPQPLQQELAFVVSDCDETLDLEQISLLALWNNPSLVVARDNYGISQAQLYNAGLLPDPQLNVSEDFPTNQLDTALIAYNIGITYDFKALIMRSGNRSVARYDSRKVFLDLLWQEWQIVSQARLLYVKILQQTKQIDYLQKAKELLTRQYSHTQQAFKSGLMPSDAIVVYFNALQDIYRQLYATEILLNRNQQDLNALLGFDPSVILTLSDEIAIEPLKAKWYADETIEILTRRADLVALRAGYQAQEWRLRQAILGQFPALNLGLTRARDNTGVLSVGYTASIGLPIFNRNQGSIAIENATRQKLFDEYQMRLNTAYSDVEKLIREDNILMAQLEEVRQGLEDLTPIAQSLERAYQEGLVDILIYTNYQVMLLTKQIEELTVQQALMEQRIALQTLLECHI